MFVIRFQKKIIILLLIFQTGHKDSAQQGFVIYVSYPSGQTR